MTEPRHSDDQFIETWNRLGSPTLVANALNLTASRVYLRRQYIENKRNIKLETWNDTSSRRTVIKHEEGRIDTTIENGVVIVFSDAHFQPSVRTTSFRAVIAAIKQLKPEAVICNGDAFDGGSISKYPRIGWDKKPTVQQELEAVESALSEIENASGPALLTWPLGNHDARFECRLAAAAPEFEGVLGFTLKEHFPSWKPCWTHWINGNVRVNHFYHSGMHDTHNNLLKGQCHQVTGHTHSLKCTPWTNAMGETIWGVNTGTLADALAGHNVDYMRGIYGNHRSGFAILTFREGKLLMPELCIKHDEDRMDFRGHLLNADDFSVA